MRQQSLLRTEPDGRGQARRLNEPRKLAAGGGLNSALEANALRETLAAWPAGGKLSALSRQLGVRGYRLAAVEDRDLVTEQLNLQTGVRDRIGVELRPGSEFDDLE